MPRVCLDPAKTAERRFNDWVRGELNRKHLRQRDLAEELGVTQENVSFLLSGKVMWKLRDAVKTVIYLGGDLVEVLGNYK